MAPGGCISQQQRVSEEGATSGWTCAAGLVAVWPTWTDSQRAPSSSQRETGGWPLKCAAVDDTLPGVVSLAKVPGPCRQLHHTPSPTGQSSPTPCQNSNTACHTPPHASPLIVRFTYFLPCSSAWRSTALASGHHRHRDLTRRAMQGERAATTHTLHGTAPPRHWG